MMALRTRGENAQAAVELAVVLPIIVLLLSAIYVFGQALVEVHQLSNAASEGARKGSFSAQSATFDSDVSEAVRTAAELPGGRLAPDQLSISSTPSRTPGEPLRVTVSYPLELDFGFWELDMVVDRSRTMRIIQ